MKKFLIKKIKKDISLIREKFYKEFANIYLFSYGDKCLIFDCGLGFFDLRKYLIGLGYKSFAVVITHAHFDHIGGINHFKDDEIFLSKRQKYFLEKREYWGLDYFKVEDFIDKDEGMVSDFYNNFYIEKKSPKQFSNNSLKFFDYEFQIIKTPGHTSDSLCFYEMNKKILLTGDTLYDGELYVNFNNSSVDLFKKSLDNLSCLNVNLVLPGHNQILVKKEMLSIIEEWKKLLN